MLKISPEFRDLIQPLSAEELDQLEQNILTEGKCRESIKVWRGYIIDGHHRYTICQKHGIAFRVDRIPLKSKNDAMIWIAENQLGRRNLSKAMRIEIACKKVALQEQPYARKHIAELAGVSESTVQKYQKIIGCSSPEVMDKVRKGEIKIDAAYKNLRLQTKTVEKLCTGEDVKYVNMMAFASKIERFYDFLMERALPALDECGVALVKERVAVHASS